MKIKTSPVTLPHAVDYELKQTSKQYKKKSHDLDCFSIFFDLRLSVQYCNMLKSVEGQKEKWEILDGGGSVT